MHDAGEVLKTAAEWLARGERVCVATIIRKQGSGPREVGAKMAVSSDGKIAGTIGGGAVEDATIRKAREVIQTGKPSTVDFDLSGRAADLDAMCGGNISVFLEPLGQASRLFVIGAGHVGLAVAKLARFVGLPVSLVDDRAEYLDVKALGDGIAPVESLPGGVPERVAVRPADYVVICTRGHSLDKGWLRAVCTVGPAYIGMLGSREKAARLVGELRSEGVAPERLETVRCPVGLAIGGTAPEEIAVSIIAEIIQVRSTRTEQ